MPERMGRDFAELVASEFESALARDPALDLEAYAQRRDQRTASSGRDHLCRWPRRSRRPASTCPQGMRMPGPFKRRAPGRPGGERGGRPTANAGRRPRRRRPATRVAMPRMPFGGPRRGPVMAPIEHNGDVVGVVWVPPLTGLRRVADRDRHAARDWRVPAADRRHGAGRAGDLPAGAGAPARARGCGAPVRRRRPDGARAGDWRRRGRRRWPTAFNRMAADLAARQAQLVEADRARRQLLADVSHELMTPLTAIRGYAETLGLPQFAPDVQGRPARRQGDPGGRRAHRAAGRGPARPGAVRSRRHLAGAGIVDVDELFERVSERHAKTAQDKQVSRS